MTSPTRTSQNVWPTQSGEDVLQITQQGGHVVGGIDGTGTPFGNLANGGLVSVTTDASLTGNGSSSSPLSVVSSPAIINTGLMADYQILPGETVASLKDYSGNGNNATGTVGTAPTITSGTGGLLCSRNGAVLLPSALNAAVTIQIYVQFQPGALTQGTYAPVLGGGTPATSGVGLAMVTGILAGNGQSSGTSVDSWGSMKNNNNSGLGNFDSTFQQFNGTGTLALVMSATDAIYVNGEAGIGGNRGSALNAQTTGVYQLGGATAGSGTSSNTYFTGTIYRALFYNRALSAQEIYQNDQAMKAAGLVRGVIPSSQRTDTGNLLLAVGDSETAGAAGTPYTTGMVLNNFTQIANIGIGGVSVATLSANAAVMGGAAYSPNSENIAIIMSGANDVSGSATTFVNNLAGLCRQYQLMGYRVFVTTVADYTGADTFKNTANLIIRQTYKTFADAMIDIAANPLIGADSVSGNTLYWSGGLHYTTMTYKNILSPMIQQAINREYGNRDFSSATTYTSGAPAAVTVSGATQSGNTMTFTATSHGFSVGQMVTVAGMLPSGYNGVWWILTTTTNTFTAYNGTTGLGNSSQAGTGAVPLQVDADQNVILGGSGSGQNFTLQTSVGLTGRKIYFKNTNTNSWTVTPFGSETINGSSSITVATGATLTLESILVSASAAGSNWISV